MLHFINFNDEKSVLFFSNSLRMILINKKDLEKIEDCYSSGETDGIPSPILKMIDEDKNWKSTVELNESDSLNRLVINVSDYCNMACTYCYAHQGDYNSPLPKVITEQTVRDVARFFQNTKIHTVQFFGGEPLVNFDGIRQLVHVLSPHKETRFTLVTNGTLLDEEKMNFFNEHHFQITVSVDGNPLINDFNRHFKNGSGVSAIIKQKIQYINNNCPNIDLNAEATYTPEHIKNHITVSESVEYIQKTLGIKRVHIVRMVSHDSKSDNEMNKLFDDSADDCLLRGKMMYLTVAQYVSALLSHHQSYYLCPALRGTVCVGTNGDIYPCFMFIGDKKYLLENVHEGRFEDLINSVKTSRFYQSNTLMNRHCTNCYLNRLCEQCLGENNIKNADPFVFDEKECQSKREYADRIMIDLWKRKKEGMCHDRS